MSAIAHDEQDDAEPYTDSGDYSTEHHAHDSQDDGQVEADDSTPLPIGTVEEELRLTIDHLKEQIKAMGYEAYRAESQREDLHRTKAYQYRNIIAVLHAQVQFQQDLLRYQDTAIELLSTEEECKEDKIDACKVKMAEVRWGMHHHMQDIERMTGWNA